MAAAVVRCGVSVRVRVGAVLTWRRSGTIRKLRDCETARGRRMRARQLEGMTITMIDKCFYTYLRALPPEAFRRI